MASHDRSHSGPVTPNDQSHPDDVELQRYADGELDTVGDAALIAHIAGCASCRDEIERMRRVGAILSLSSRPPADLFERIKARRAAGERVMLDVGDHTEAAEEPATRVPARVESFAERARSAPGGRTRWWASRRALAVAATIVALAAIGGSMLTRLDQRAGPSPIIARNGPDSQAIATPETTGIRPSGRAPRTEVAASPTNDSLALAWAQLPAKAKGDRWRATAQGFERLRATFPDVIARSATDSLIVLLSDQSFDGASIRTDVGAYVAEWSALLTGRPAFPVAVAETQRQGASEADRRLLVERAAAVRGELRRLGLAPERRVKAASGVQPLVGNVSTIEIIVVRPPR